MSSHERFQVALGGPWPTRLSPGLPVATQAGPAALGSASGSGGPRNASASRRLSAVSLRPESAAGTAAGARLQHVIRNLSDRMEPRAASDVARRLAGQPQKAAPVAAPAWDASSSAWWFMRRGPAAAATDGRHPAGPPSATGDVGTGG